VVRILGSVLVLLVVACSAFVLRASWESLEDAKPARAQITGNCPNARLIDTFKGNGDQQTDTFTTTTDSFRVSFKTKNAIGSGFKG
jgi:hypothetical protein